ncbi:MAG: DUF5060 domain-containing protein, partial [Acidobacteria bacterium]|nr:DUF5060 domain-containing protein [Acidobacteriota bacterium]
LAWAGIVFAAMLDMEALVFGQDIPLWGRFETSITNDRAYANPFTDVTLNCTYTRPDGTAVTFFGFHDGDGNGGQSGEVWRIRFMPDHVGTWSYTCSFSDGTPGKRGTFRSTSTGAKPGPLRADPDNPRCWLFANGTRFAPRSYILEHIFAIGEPDVRRYAIEYFFGAKHKFNLCTANLLNHIPADSPVNYEGMSYQYPSPNQEGQYTAVKGNGLLPFVFSGAKPLFDGGSNVDWTRPSIACWTNADKVLQELESRNTVWFNHWGMIGYNWANTLILKVPPTARESCLRYWIARLAPYWNVTWNIAGEWDEIMSLAELDKTGNYIKQLDPWNHPLSAHSLKTTPDRPWVDYRIEQMLAGNISDPAQSAELAIKDYSNKPVYAFETSWEGLPIEHKLSPDLLRRGAWGSMMGGAFFNYGEGFGPTLTFGDGGAFRFLEIMHDFIYGLEYWKLSPSKLPAQGKPFMDAGSLCLANPGQEYVVYLPLGGRVTLDLSAAQGRFGAKWLDPRTGTCQEQSPTSGGASRTFTAPDTNDWVLHVRKFWAFSRARTSG